MDTSARDTIIALVMGIPALLLALGGLLCLRAWRRRRREALANAGDLLLDPTPIEKLAPGTAKIVGRVQLPAASAADAHRAAAAAERPAPLTDAAVIALEERQRFSAVAKTNYWTVEDWSFAAVPFAIDDGTGVVYVDPGDARPYQPADERGGWADTVTAKTVGFGAGMIRFSPGGRASKTESGRVITRSVDVGDEITLISRFVDRPHADGADYRSAGRRWEIEPDTEMVLLQTSVDDLLASSHDGRSYLAAAAICFGMVALLGWLLLDTMT